MNSSSSTLLASGGNQIVGAIDGNGTVQVNAGASLTANLITAGALVIGGDAANSAVLNIAASDTNGDPTASTGFAVAGSLATSACRPAAQVHRASSPPTWRPTPERARAFRPRRAALSPIASAAAAPRPCPSLRPCCCSSWGSWPVSCWPRGAKRPSFASVPDEQRTTNNSTTSGDGVEATAATMCPVGRHHRRPAGIFLRPAALVSGRFGKILRGSPSRVCGYAATPPRVPDRDANFNRKKLK